MTIPVTATWVGLHALLATLLAFNVIRWRLKGQVGFGDGGNKDLQRAIRVQQNNLEYVPLALLLIMTLELMGASAVALNALGAALLLARIGHALGLGRAARTSPGRFLGTLVTQLVMVIGGVWAVLLGIAVI